MTCLDVVIAVEAVELREQLQHGALHFSVTALVAVKALRTCECEQAQVAAAKSVSGERVLSVAE